MFSLFRRADGLLHKPDEIILASTVYLFPSASSTPPPSPSTQTMITDSQRPLLLPQNRRIRHLQAIYLRNLSLTLPQDPIPSHTQSNTSHSSTSLAVCLSPHSCNNPQLPFSESSHCSSLSKLWRQSASWLGVLASSNEREPEQMIDSNAANLFISLHCASQIEPIYISEIVKNSRNPTFRAFDISIFGPTTTRLNIVVVKVWTNKGQDFELYMEKEVNLSSLNFIGRLHYHQYPPNCILFQLIDGIYSTDVSTEYPKPKTGTTFPTSSYSALMRLSNLDQSMHDTLATLEILAPQVNDLLERKHVGGLTQTKEEVILANHYLTLVKKLLKTSIRRRNDLEASLEARRKAIQTGLEVQTKAMKDVENAQAKLVKCRMLLTTTVFELSGQRRRICEDLQLIYPIDPINDHPFRFTICGLELPNSCFDDVNEDTVSAALGYVAQIVHMLQYYLSVPLPYPISPYNPKPTIRDLISILQDKQRTFPLYLKGTVRFRFEYGLFLLNKDIEWLAKSQGLKIFDLRTTLSNLKHLLYICSAGNTDLPARKSGGVRGLLSRSSIETEPTCGSQ